MENRAAHNRLQYLEDGDLVAVAQTGSLEACDELVTRFRGAVLTVAGQVVGRREMAEDVAQEAFLLAFRALPQLQDRTKFAGWLYAITRHRARRVGQREGACQPVESSALEYLLTEQDAGESGENDGNPLHALLRAETQATVRRLLAELSPAVQTVVYLFYWEQWPAPRIAAFLSLPLTTIKWRLHTGKRQMGRALEAFLDTGTSPHAGTEGENHVGSRSEKRDSAASQTAAEDDGTRRTRRADRQL